MVPPRIVLNKADLGPADSTVKLSSSFKLWKGIAKSF